MSFSRNQRTDVGPHADSIRQQPQCTEPRMPNEPLVATTTGNVVPTTTGNVVPTTTGNVVPTATGDVVPTSTSNVVPTATGDVVPTATGDVVPTSASDVVPTATGDVVITASYKRYSDIAAVLAFNRLRNDNRLCRETGLGSSNGDRVVDGCIQILGPSDSSDHAKRQGRRNYINFLHLYIPILPNQKNQATATRMWPQPSSNPRPVALNRPCSLNHSGF
jgi:hypothetical protein